MVTIEEKVVKFLQTKLWEDLGKEKNFEIKLTDLLEEDLGLDSIDRVELWLDLEVYFNVTFDSKVSDEAYKIAKTVEDIVNIIKMFGEEN